MKDLVALVAWRIFDTVSFSYFISNFQFTDDIKFSNKNKTYVLRIYHVTYFRVTLHETRKHAFFENVKLKFM